MDKLIDNISELSDKDLGLLILMMEYMWDSAYGDLVLEYSRKVDEWWEDINAEAMRRTRMKDEYRASSYFTNLVYDA